MLVAGFSSSVAAQSSATGDAARGAQIYQASCGSCHSINANRVGPAHRGVVGRRAGTMAGYNYSAALRASRIIWDARTIDRFLQDPQKMIPGTKMGFRLTDPARRTDVIAYLRQQSRPVPK
ncbi:c-type cytochrome [Sphingopyxis sp. Geo48]|uniref:c-type cytochrome n=1 Tax=Sphingopyxis sp. Geo48 TaxID=545241 RepID=UPI0024B78C1E|nr:c-type cytochrome [Sphingopyxis sp. Geo48]